MAAYRWRWWFPRSREALWARVSDTDWLNRRAGLPPVTYEYEPLATGGSRTKATIAFGPMRVQWLEPPFEWSQPEYYAIERRYIGGPLRCFNSRTSLLEENGGTAIEVAVQIQARSRLWSWVVPIVAWYGKRGAGRAFREAAAEVAPEPAIPQQKGAQAFFARPQLRVAGYSDDLLDKLGNFLNTAEEAELAKMRPYDLADRWREPRRVVLSLFLSAVRAGLLNLSWDVLCSSCRGAKQSVNSLDKVSGQVHCEACNIQFGAQFDRSVEVTFNAHPLGKGLNVPTYCLVGPHTSRHVIAQERLKPAGSQSLAFGIAPGRYLANAVTLAQLPFAVEARDATAKVAATVGEAGIEGIPAHVEASHLDLELINRLERDILVRIESSEWPDTIVTAADVTALQEFRDLFSSEVLASGLELGIQSLTVLFTDLVASTEMYSKSGDAPAFRIVRDHFDQMRGIIQRYEGAIVKTIGDAVMAVFRDSGNCLEAALRLPAAVGAVDWEGGKLRLRVGFHSGPCIAMNANDRLDYFGTTVNLASRLEHTAAGGEVAFTATTAKFPHMRAVIEKYGLHSTGEDLTIKGFDDPVAVLRVAAFA